MKTTSTLGKTLVNPANLATLRRQLTGDLLQAGNGNYDAARRLVNRRFDRRPALIVRAESAQDVAHAITFACEQGLEIAVRSGGHSVPGHSVGDGLMIDLSRMRRIDLDPVRRIAQVQPGVSNGELVLALGAQGFATTTGTCATVGMGGSTLGGGIGWLIGRFGMTIDNVLAFEVVTADGRVRVASADEHPDLFWALRGGGGNFGVVTNITYQLHPLGRVLGGALIFPFVAAPAALRAYRDTTSSAPDELLAHAVLTTVPEIGPALIIQTCYSGEDLTEGERVLTPLRDAATPAVDLIAARSYAELYMMLTPPLPPGVTWYDTAYTLRSPSDAALDALVARAAERPSPLTLVNVHQVHGAATRVAPDATAFALRYPHYTVANIGMWLEGDGVAETDWAERANARMAPFTSPGVNVNFLGDEGEDAIRAAYGANYSRLAAIKGCYDPENVFWRNQNIRNV